MISDTGYAKINLALHVRHRRADGYHDIESLFAFAADGDRLHVAPAATLTLAITGPFAAGLFTDERNLVMMAATAVQQAFGVTVGAALTLEKNLPVASGIGGGSADAAAALRLLARLWSIGADDPRVMAIARTLGADVPACLASMTIWGEGRGDILRPLAMPALAGTPVLLVNPRIGVPTPQVFAGWDGVDRGALDPLDYANGRNDLTPAATAIVPAIAAILGRLARCDGASTVRMAGSGATCFALFKTAPARDAAALQFSDMWTLASVLR